MITDLAPYRQLVDKFDLNEEQMLELVNSLAMIVDMIYDQHLGIPTTLSMAATKKM